MVNAKEDLTGKTFERWTVLKQAEDYIDKRGKHYARWLCECSCEDKTLSIIMGRDLISGKTKSCGCYKKEVNRQKGKNKKYNIYDLSGEYGIGYDCNSNEFYFDLEDYDLIKDYRWWVDKKGYVINALHNIKFHRLVMGVSGFCCDIDHIHGAESRNDNRKSNLRIVTRSQNQMNVKTKSNNTSGVTGVSWDKTKDKWVSYLQANKKNMFLGYFDNFDDAVKARKEAEEKYFGEYSYDNSINN